MVTGLPGNVVLVNQAVRVPPGRGLNYSEPVRLAAACSVTE